MNKSAANKAVQDERIESEERREGARLGMTHVIGLGTACGIHILEKV